MNCGLEILPWQLHRNDGHFESLQTVASHPQDTASRAYFY